MALISEAKREANRRNAQRSTGPRTEEGRQAVRLNAVKHGLTATTPVLPEEDGEAFAALLAGFEARFAPQDEAEREAVRELAESSWRRRRGARFEAIALQALIAKEEAGELTVDDVLNMPTLLLRIGRYEGQLSRAWDRALVRLRMMRSLQPEKRPQPSPAQPAAAEVERAERRPDDSRSAASAPVRRSEPLRKDSGGAPNSQFSAEFGFVSSPSTSPPMQKRAA